jgi:hypothetical protein
MLQRSVGASPRVFSDDPTCCDTAECRVFHQNKQCFRAAIIA